MATLTVMNLLLFALLLGISLCIMGDAVLSEVEDEESLAKKFLIKLESEVRPVCHQRALMEWNFHTNLTDFNRKKSLESAIEYSLFWRKMWEETRNFDWRSFKDPDIRRQFSMMATLGVAILPDHLLKRYNILKQSMESTYGKATVCDFYNTSKCDLLLEPEITEIFLKSRNPEELGHIWLQWRNVTGATLKQNYTEFLSLMHIVAEMNNFSSPTEYELRAYQTETLSINDFRAQIDSLWKTLNPFYLELHAYVRFKLKKFYGNAVFHGSEGRIPSHLLGNLWAETWENIEDIVIPFINENLNVNTSSITQKMQQLEMTPIDMVKLAESFFVSLGFPKLHSNFWKNSILEKKLDSDMICHASAWDMCNHDDFRIKQCTTITETDLLTLHHELGHIYYQMSYKHLPKIYRDGSSPATHEAIGDLIALSVQTTTHMESIGLIDSNDDNHNDTESEINYLMRIALVKIAFLPYGYILDKWKWDGAYNVKNSDKQQTTTGTSSSSSLNCQWWELREKVQGVGKPANVTYGEEFLDPASKYHVISNVPYVRYFVSMVLQFQLHESLCKEARNTKPLHLCSIYNSKRAGAKLQQLLSLGASKPWPDALEIVTGTRNLSSKSILRYFEPLYKWLKEENVRNKQIPGWKTSTTCNKNPSSSSANTNKFKSYAFIIFVILWNISL